MEEILRIILTEIKIMIDNDIEITIMTEWRTSTKPSICDPRACVDCSWGNVYSNCNFINCLHFVLGLETVPSWQCPPQMATAPSCPSRRESWELHWRSLPLWKYSPLPAPLKKRAKRLQQPEPHPPYPSRRALLPLPRPTSPQAEKAAPLSGPQMRERQSPSLSLERSPLTHWRPGGSPPLQKACLPLPLRRQCPQVPVHRQLLNLASTRSHPAPRKRSSASPRSLPLHPKSSTAPTCPPLRKGP